MRNQRESFLGEGLTVSFSFEGSLETIQKPLRGIVLVMSEMNDALKETYTVYVPIQTELLEFEGYLIVYQPLKL